MTPADKQPEQQQAAAAAPAEVQRSSSKRELQTVEGTEVQGREQAVRRDKPPSFKVGCRREWWRPAARRRRPTRRRKLARPARRHPWVLQPCRNAS